MIDGYLYLIDLVRFLLFRDDFFFFFARSSSLFPCFLHFLCYYKQTQTITPSAYADTRRRRGKSGYYSQLVSHLFTADHAAQIRDSLRRQEPSAPEPSLSSRSFYEVAPHIRKYSLYFIKSASLIRDKTMIYKHYIDKSKPSLDYPHSHPYPSFSQKEKRISHSRYPFGAPPFHDPAYSAFPCASVVHQPSFQFPPQRFHQPPATVLVPTTLYVEVYVRVLTVVVFFPL